MYTTFERMCRPIRGSNVVTMNFDRMGRRTFYKEEVDGVETKHLGKYSSQNTFLKKVK